MKTKEWFVILTESEIKKLQTESQIAVYRSIKSFASNGRAEIALSSREIAGRTKISHVYVSKVLTQLTVLGVVSVVGVEKRLGGQVNIYKVLTQLTPNSDISVNTVNSLKNKVLTVDDKVLTTDSESVNSTGTKSRKVKSNKVSKKIDKVYLTQHEIWEVALKNSCDISEVLNTYWDVLDPENRKKYNIDNTSSRLSSWVRRGISKGTIKTTNDFASLEMLKFQEPSPEKADLLVKPEK